MLAWLMFSSPTARSPVSVHHWSLSRLDNFTISPILGKETCWRCRSTSARLTWRRSRRFRKISESRKFSSLPSTPGFPTRIRPGKCLFNMAKSYWPNPNRLEKGGLLCPPFSCGYLYCKCWGEYVRSRKVSLSLVCTWHFERSVCCHFYSHSYCSPTSCHHRHFKTFNVKIYNGDREIRLS